MMLDGRLGGRVLQRDLNRTAIPFKSTCNHAIIRSSSDSLTSDAGLSFR